MVWCLTAPSHYLNQCWLIISKVKWHSSDSNSQEITQQSIIEISLKITRLELHSNLPGANELNIIIFLHMLQQPSLYFQRRHIYHHDKSYCLLVDNFLRSNMRAVPLRSSSNCTSHLANRLEWIHILLRRNQSKCYCYYVGKHAKTCVCIYVCQWVIIIWGILCSKES